MTLLPHKIDHYFVLPFPHISTDRSFFFRSLAKSISYFLIA